MGMAGDLGVKERALDSERASESSDDGMRGVVHPRSIANAQWRPVLEVPRPSVPSLARSVPEGDEWIHEIEVCGLRTFVRIVGRVVEFTNHLAEDLADESVHRALGRLRVGDALVDGVLAVVEPDGVTRADGIERASRTDAGLSLFLFDLIHLDGYDLRSAPLSARKRALQHILEDAGSMQGSVRFVEHVSGGGAELVNAGRHLGIPGVVSKRVDSIYESGNVTTWVRVVVRA